MMKKVRQTRGGQPGGNCYQAAVASFFGIDLDDVPDFPNEVGDPYDETDHSWLIAFIDWVRDRYGLEVLPIPFEFVAVFDLKVSGIVTGFSGDADHSVVYRDGAFFWNPAGPEFGDLDEPLIVYTIGLPAVQVESVIAGAEFMRTP